MLRRVSQINSSAYHTFVVGLYLSPSIWSWCSVSGVSTTIAAYVTVRTPSRTFFPPGTPGKDLLRRLTTPSGPTKAFSPLENLRPPAPPSASDAQPFGSLNRTNQLRRYVNVNTSAAAAAGAGDGNNSCSTTGSTGTASSTAFLPQQRFPPKPAPMDLSKLVRRHTSSPIAGATEAASSNSSATASAPDRTPTDSSFLSTDRSNTVPPSPAGLNSGVELRRSTAKAATSTHATVARAQAAIAAAQRAKEAKQQLRAEKDTLYTGGMSGHTDNATKDAQKALRDHKDGRSSNCARQHVQVYKEHCTIGWSPEEFYRVVADVEHYTDFLPWCAGSEVHTVRRVRVPRGRRLLPENLSLQVNAIPTSSVPRDLHADNTCSTAAGAGIALGSPAAFATDADAIAAAEAELVDAVEMTATLTIGFSFLKEQYTSRVTLYPGTKIIAVLYDDEADGTNAQAGRGAHMSSSTGHHDSFVVSLFKKAASTAGAAAKRSILKHLLCEWEFCPVPGKPNAVEVVFSVSFEFKNPLHSHMIMSNVVSLMTRSFERRCESLYGPPSASKESLPLFH